MMVNCIHQLVYHSTTSQGNGGGLVWTGYQLIKGFIHKLQKRPWQEQNLAHALQPHDVTKKEDGFLISHFSVWFQTKISSVILYIG